jgi:hypothetical protein
MQQNCAQKEKVNGVEGVKKHYIKPEIRSQKVLEKAALICSGVFYNSLYNLKSSYYTCGYNSS